MECTNCETNMELVNISKDTHDEKGNHVEIDLGKAWICPKCDHEEDYILETNDE